METRPFRGSCLFSFHGTTLGIEKLGYCYAVLINNFVAQDSIIVIVDGGNVSLVCAWVGSMHIVRPVGYCQLRTVAICFNERWLMIFGKRPVYGRKHGTVPPT